VPRPAGSSRGIQSLKVTPEIIGSAGAANCRGGHPRATAVHPRPVTLRAKRRIETIAFSLRMGSELTIGSATRRSPGRRQQATERATVSAPTTRRGDVVRGVCS
jgi:hypothetical protein